MRHLSRNGYDSVDGKLKATQTLQNVTMQGRSPLRSRGGFGMYNQTGKATSTSARNTMGNAPPILSSYNGPHATAKAESIRAQVATPRNINQVSVEELAQHQRYTNIVSQSRARRQIGGSSYTKPAQINTSLNRLGGGSETEAPSIFSPTSTNGPGSSGNIFGSVPNSPGVPRSTTVRTTTAAKLSVNFARLPTK